jgi:hypothetical protein
MPPGCECDRPSPLQPPSREQMEPVIFVKQSSSLTLPVSHTSCDHLWPSISVDVDREHGTVRGSATSPPNRPGDTRRR